MNAVYFVTIIINALIVRFTTHNFTINLPRNNEKKSIVYYLTLGLGEGCGLALGLGSMFK